MWFHVKSEWQKNPESSTLCFSYWHHCTLKLKRGFFFTRDWVLLMKNHFWSHWFWTEPPLQFHSTITTRLLVSGNLWKLVSSSLYSTRTTTSHNTKTSILALVLLHRAILYYVPSCTREQIAVVKLNHMVHLRPTTLITEQHQQHNMFVTNLYDHDLKR